MTTYIAILRGINVGGNRMIKMDALKQLFAELGFKNIQTYIQSGNIVFQGKETDSRKLETKISAAITGKFTFDVPVIVIEYDDFRQIISDNPFLSDKKKDTAYLHVTFLSGEPERENCEKIK